MSWFPPIHGATNLLRVLPDWPRERFLKLVPKLWSRTRDRLNPVEFAADLGPLSIPQAMDPTTQEPPGAVLSSSSISRSSCPSLRAASADRQSGFQAAGTCILNPWHRSTISAAAICSVEGGAPRGDR